MCRSVGRMLCTLVLAECLEGEDRFLDSILDIVWAICEESGWELPAHFEHLPTPFDNETPKSSDFNLPEVDEPLIGLSSAMTGALLAGDVFSFGWEVAECVG